MIKIQTAFVFVMMSLGLFAAGEKKICKCHKLLSNLISDTTDHVGFTVRVVWDSTRLQTPVMNAVEYFREDSANLRYGESGLLFADGFFLRGQYDKDGSRDGVWFLYDCKKRIKVYEQYHYRNGVLFGIVTKKKSQQEKSRVIVLDF